MKRRSVWIIGGLALLALTGCGGLMKAHMQLGAGNYDQAIAMYEAHLSSNPASVEARSRLGFAYLKTGRIQDAVKAFETVLKQAPGDPYAVLYLGLAYVNQEAYGKAIETWNGYRNATLPLVEEEIRRQLTLLQIAESQRMAKHALAEEAKRSTEAPAPNSIAVFYYADMSPDKSLAAYQKGLAAMIISDLGKIKSLRVIERLRLQALLEEMRLAQSGIVDARNAPRLGRLLGAKNLVVGSLMKGSLKVATTVNDQTSTASVAESDFWQIPILAVKTAVQALGLSLTPAEQAAVGVVHTKSLKAFTYYGQALMAQDAGNWKNARDLFMAALKEDPKFDLAAEGASGSPGANAPSVAALATMSAAQLSAAMNTAIDAAAAAQSAADQESDQMNQGGGGGGS